jgi:RHS repeat-associated protein
VLRTIYDHRDRVVVRKVGASAGALNQIETDYDLDSLLKEIRVKDTTGTLRGKLTYTRDTKGYGLVFSDTTANTTSTVTETFSSAGAPNTGYNGYGELKAETVVGGATNMYQLGSVTRDSLGRLTARTETIVVPSGSGLSGTMAWSYTYDTAGRLWTATCTGTPSTAGCNGVTQTFTYDSNGNRAGCTYDANQDRMTACGGTSYTYSTSGSLLSKGSTTFTYDLNGALWGATPASGAIAYFVDAKGQRIKRTKAGSSTQWLYDELGRVIAELDNGGAVRQVFAYGTKSTVPELVWQPQATPSPGRMYRVVTDHLGSVRLVLDLTTATTPATVQRIDYDAWGNATADWADTSNGFTRIPFGFAGGLWDRDTNLIRFGARDYDPSTGRWTAKDPLRFDGGDTNLYAYVGNNPVNRVDPSGKSYRDDDPKPDLPDRPFPDTSQCKQPFGTGALVALRCCIAICTNTIQPDPPEACPTLPDEGSWERRCVRDCVRRAVLHHP